jgi:hypothetical protein
VIEIDVEPPNQTTDVEPPNQTTDVEPPKESTVEDVSQGSFTITLFSQIAIASFSNPFTKSPFFPLDLPDNTEGNDKASESEIDDITVY